MKPLSVKEIRALDAAHSDMPLMRMAANAIADLALDVAARVPVKPVFIAFAGGGANGEDARIALSMLRERGCTTECVDVRTAPPRLSDPPAAFPRRAVVLDGILGIGFTPPLRPDAARAIELVNALREERGAVVIAVDLPSGLSADASSVAPDALTVRADVTLTMGAPKKAFLSPSALERCGETLVAPLYPAAATADVPDGVSFVTAPRPRFRKWDSNKGDFGHVAVFAGSAAYPGAAILAARGALRGGAGLVTAFVPEAARDALLAAAPEAIVRAYSAPALDAETVAFLAPDLSGKILLAGPGLSRAPGVQGALSYLLSTPGIRAAVLDADALPAARARIAPAGLPLLITPHPGEAARLLGASVADVQANRPAAARALVEATGATVLLKGSGSLVASPDGRLALVPTGTPALAKGGSGDVLAGLCAALLANGLAPFDAACEAAYTHGHAAFLASLRSSQASFAPSDLLNEK